MIRNFEDLKLAVKEQLDVEEILRGMTHVDSSGKNGICPFHQDKKKGSFKIFKNTNSFKCFACGETGDALDLLIKQRNKDFVPVVYELGYELGLISAKEMENKRVNVNDRDTLNKNVGVTVKTINKNNNVKETKVMQGLSDEEIALYDLVYRVFSHYCKLDEKDKTHLLEVRKINPEKLNDYFSIRSLKFKDTMPQMVEFLGKKGITKEDIIKVPGFAYTKEGDICLASYIRGIGMKIRNSDGKVTGIQVRTELEDKKYLWLSSGSKNGKSSSTPPAIEYPKLIVEDGRLNKFKTLRNAGNSILITEGKLKAEALSNTYNNTAIGIAGINNWRNKVKKDFLNITASKDIENIVVFADSDCSYNPNIYIQFKSLLETELFNTKQNKYIAYWNIQYGKGVDDVIHNNHGDKIKYMELNEYNKLFNKFLEEIEEYLLDIPSKNKEIKINAYNKIFNL